MAFAISNPTIEPAQDRAHSRAPSRYPRYKAESKPHSRRPKRRTLGPADLRFTMHQKTPMVSWKKSWECNNAHEWLEMKHSGPHHAHVSIDAGEGYTTDTGKYISREVMLTLRMDAARALRDMLTTAIDNHDAHANQEGA